MKQPAIILFLVGSAVALLQAMMPAPSCGGRTCEGPASVAPDFSQEISAKAGAVAKAPGARDQTR